MSPESVFSFVNTFVLPFWIIIWFIPKWKHRNTAVYIAAAILAATYATYLLLGPGVDITQFGSLEGVKALFTNETAVLIGWIHYLAFDMLIGNWVVNQSQELGIKHILVLPCLLFCFMLGPVGYLLFQILKFTKIGRIN